MNTSLRRIYALLIKELIVFLKNPAARMSLIMPPALQLFIFAFAATMEVRNVSILILNEDSGAHGAELVSRIYGSPSFGDLRFTHTLQDARLKMDNREVQAVFHIPEDFSRKLESGESPRIQILLDGRRTVTTQKLNGYLTAITQTFAQEFFESRGLSSGAEVSAVPEILERDWFNQNLTYLWFTLPSLLGLLTCMITLMVSSSSISRERELGTLEQLIVSPLSPFEILAGKTLTAVLIGSFEGVMIWFVAVFLFRVPFEGSLLLLAVNIFVFVFSVVGVGLFISSLCNTQQQSTLGLFIFVVPTVSLSGYSTPVDNMPKWLQIVTLANPLRHFLVNVRGIFLKQMTLVDTLSNLWPLFLIGAATLLFAYYFVQKKLS